MTEYKGKEYLTTPAHPAAEKFPFQDEELDRIVESMSTDGFDPTHPIIVDAKTGRIVAGRRRELAALVNGIEPVYDRRDFESESEIIRFVMREELFRRHLKPGQVAVYAVELNKLLESEGLFNHQIADAINVSKQTVYDADKVLSSSPDLAEKVKSGKMSVSAAAKQIKEQEDQVEPEETEESDGPEYPPKSWMPNYSDAAESVLTLGNASSKIEDAIKMLKKIPLDGTIAKRTQLVENLKVLEEIAKQFTDNLPTHTCPGCAGTGIRDGKHCKYCDGYGIVDSAHAVAHEYMWAKGSADVYQRKGK